MPIWEKFKMASDALLEVSDLSLSFGSTQALCAVSFALKQREVLAIVGANGAGKSSLLRTIAGLHRPAAGSVYLNGQDLLKLKTFARVRQGVSLCPEGRMVFSKLSVFDNLRLGAWVRRHARGGELKKDLAMCFELFPRLAERRSQLAGTLSGGEQQMLAFSRALMSRPCLLMLDEPTLGLAPVVAREILQAVGNLALLPFKCSILLIEQNASAALNAASRVVVLERGRVSWAGDSKTLQSNESFAQVYFGIT